MRFGEIKTGDFVIEYDRESRSEVLKDGARSIRYRCYPKKIGETTTKQQEFIQAHKGEMMAPAAMMKMFKEA